MQTFHVKYLCFLFLLSVIYSPLFAQSAKSNYTNFTINHGAIIRGDSTQKKIALVFTGDEFGDGANYISDVLKDNQINASFFLTGNFYRNKSFKKVIAKLKKNGNY
ncbi:MAG: hypothetical protein ABIP35_15825, partial [Ginsengibacter sp.]